MIQHSGRPMTSQDPSPSSSSSSNRQQQQQQQQQPRLFNRMPMPGFLFQKRQGSFTQEDYPEPSSSTASGMVTSSIGGGGEGGPPSHYSGINEDSRVDSLFSSLQSNQSNMRVNPNTPPPVRTVRLDGGIVHRQNGPSSQHDIAPSTAPQQSTITTSDAISTSTSSTDIATTATTASDSTTGNNSPEDFDQAFEKMAHEYGLPNNVAKTLSLEAKQVLLRNSQGNFQRQSGNGNHSNNTNGFFSWRTWGIQKKQKHHMNVFQDNFFDPTSVASTSTGGPPKKNNKRGHNGNSLNNNRKKAYSTSARGRAKRASIMDFNHDTNSNSNDPQHNKSFHRYDRATKKVLSPEYFIHLLKDCHVRDLDESQVQGLRVCLCTVKASWTTQFLQLDGYLVISNLFRQMIQAPKRSPNDDKILQHLAKCFKAIMTHEQAGIGIVLTNPVGLTYIRDLLFGPDNQKHRSLYSLSVVTRAQFMNILCTLANIQTTLSETVPYIHGYDVLRRLLLDANTDQSALSTDPMVSINTTVPASPDDQDNHANNNNSNTSTDFPFRMTLKEDPQTVMKTILENDPFYTPGQPFKPRYTAWMRELQYTVEKEIEPITFLAQVLDYKFESAFRQLRIKPPTPQQQQELDDVAESKQKDDPDEEGTGSVMVDDGVVEYLIAHLRLINTIVATQPTFYTGPYDDGDREKVRLEVMMSGFDKISKALQSCPHPTLYAFYFRYLQPLLQPLADIRTNVNHEQTNITSNSSDNTASGSHITPPLNDDMIQWQDDVKQPGGSGILFEQPPWADDYYYDEDDDDDDYEDYDSNDEQDMTTDTLGHNDDSDSDDDDENLGMGFSQESGRRQWRMAPAMSR